jgi:hypothetical protein
MNRCGGWVLTVPLMLVGLLAGHSAGYRLAYSVPHERAHTLDETGHAYLAYVPTAVALVGAILLAAAVVTALDAYRGRGAVATPPVALALLPPLAFAIQEHVERLVETGSFPWATALEPAFVYGLALQVPFALCALAVGTALVAAAASLGRALRRGAPPRVIVPSPRFLAPQAAEVVRPADLARGYSGRAPPLLALTS